MPVIRAVAADTNPLHDLAVIIPVGPHERAWEQLLGDLTELPAASEIILVGTHAPSPQFETFQMHPKLKAHLRWIRATQGRALQLNAGARATHKKYLWFLHADSRTRPQTVSALENNLRRHPNALHYSVLRFLSDGPRWMRLNEIGCWFRSRLLGIPFGDQGFSLSREIFDQIGGFPENTPYGEDHLFVWSARQRRIPLRCTGAVLETSARRYADTGWLNLTWCYYQRWVRQAIPEWFKCLKSNAS